MDKIYIFGHRNPDTDSVCAAISLSYLKNKMGYNTIPVVLSSINLESKYALNYFNVKEPVFFNDVKIKIKDIDYSKKFTVLDTDSIKDAFVKMNNNDVGKIPVIDSNKKMMGIVSMKDIAKEQLSSNYEKVNSSYDKILDVIDGTEILRFDNEIVGNLLVAGYKSTTFIEEMNLTNNDILIVGDRHSIIEYAVKCGVKLIVVTGEHNIKDEHLELARKNKVNIIKSAYNTLYTSRVFNLCNYTKTIMNTNSILCVNENDNLSDFIEMANKKKYSYYPVLDNKGRCLGIIRLSDVVSNKKKKVILVDHNSYEQSAIGLEETEILEVIDHHNIGNVATNMPINFRNMPVGSTNTIIYTMFRDNNIEIPSDIAGIMLSGIISDTLLFKSPTTTNMDIDAAIVLSHIAKVNYNEYGMAMLKAGSTLKGRTKEEILYTDYKSYPVSSKKIGLSQIFTMNIDEVLEEAEDYVNLMNDICKKSNYYFICLFVTDIINNGSYVIYSDNAKDIIKESFNLSSIYQGIFIKDILSRKKQVVPIIMDYMENN